MAPETEWEAPIPVWIESINIDMDDEMPASDLTVTIPTPVILPSICTPVSTKMHSFITISTSPTEHHSLFSRDSINLLFEDVKVVAESPVKITTPATPSISPVKRAKPAQLKSKPTRRPGRRVNVDPSGRTQRRKDKQRGYEKDYRTRMKSRAVTDKAEWIQLEAQVRQMLAKRTSVVVMGALDDSWWATSQLSTVSMRQRYLELLQEERALRESEALDSSVLAGYQAMEFWGGTNATSRGIREKWNALPGLRSCHTFEFSW